MAGAKKRLEDFYSYKKNSKNTITTEQLTCEGIFNNLKQRLSSHKRPEFVPASGHSPKDFSQDVNYLEKLEQEQNVALHTELNRQIRLAQLDEQHKSKFEQLQSWIQSKKSFLSKNETINSIR